MQNEKIAAIILVIIIAGALSVYVLSADGNDIFKNLFPTDKETTPVIENEIQLGDCIDIQYIGRYASNNTVFDSSYADVENKLDGMALQVFVSLDPNELPPIDYRSNYSAGIIEGLMEQLPGLKLGETYVLDPIDPAKAYGENKLEVGAEFKSATFAINTLKPALSLNQTLKVTRLTSVLMDLEWINIEETGIFTMPQLLLGNLSSIDQEEMIDLPPPYFIWENASEIQSINEDSVTVVTTPNKLTNIYENIEQIQYGFGTNDIFIIFPDATVATYDDTTITLTSDPEIGAEYVYEYNYFGQTIVMNYMVHSETDTVFNISATYEGTNESQYLDINKTLSFSRTYEMKKTYTYIPMVYAESLIGADLEREGYSFHNLAGESLVFEVYIERIIKTSQEDN